MITHVEIKISKGTRAPQAAWRRGWLSIYERKCLPHGGCGAPYVRVCVCVCLGVGVCFMCLVNIYAAVNDEARKRCAKQVPTTTTAATTNW